MSSDSRHIWDGALVKVKNTFGLGFSHLRMLYKNITLFLISVVVVLPGLDGLPVCQLQFGHKPVQVWRGRWEAGDRGRSTGRLQRGPEVW